MCWFGGMQHTPKQWHYVRRPRECLLDTYYCASGRPNVCCHILRSLFFVNITFTHLKSDIPTMLKSRKLFLPFFLIKFTFIIKQHSCFVILLFRTGSYVRPSNDCLTANVLRETKSFGDSCSRIHSNAFWYLLNSMCSIARFTCNCKTTGAPSVYMPNCINQLWIDVRSKSATKVLSVL